MQSRGPVPAPDDSFFAIGDVHGCLDLLRDLLDRIAEQDAKAHVICLGDMVDRGEQSAGVLALLYAQVHAKGARFVCLRGNHEQMMLDAIDNPLAYGPNWLRNGGLQTLASFGVAGLSETARGDTLIQALAALQKALGPDQEQWLRTLPLVWRSGNICAVHAGADPARPIGAQSPDVLLWGHPDFARTPRADGIWIVHGHTIVPSAHVAPGRIAVDTGAYATQRLSAAYVAEGAVRFITAQSSA